MLVPRHLDRPGRKTDPRRFSFFMPLCPCCAAAADPNCTTRKVDSSGNLLWSRNHTAVVYAVAANSTADMVVTGGERAADGKSIRAYDLSGNLLWSAAHGTDSGSDGFDNYGAIRRVRVNDNGEVWCAGTRTNSATIRMFDSSGSEQWTFDTGGPTEFSQGSIPNSLFVDSSGNAYIVTNPQAKTGLVDSADYATIWKLNSSGSESWVTTSIQPGPAAISLNGSDVWVRIASSASPDPNESQVLTITGSPTGGDFKLTHSALTSAAIAHNASASTVASTINTMLSGLYFVTCGGGPLPAAITIRFAYDATNPAAFGITANNLTGGTSPTPVVKTLFHGSNQPGALRKLNTSGVYQSRLTAPPGGSRLEIDGSGNFYMIASSRCSKYNSSGTSLFTGAGSQTVADIFPDGSGGAFLGTNGSGGRIERVNSSGTSQWTYIHHSGSGNVNAVCADGSGNGYLGGTVAPV